jgi:acyl-CoA synthetase (AMP-forming)/AMP-acid ligase II/acyl carrier protein
VHGGHELVLLETAAFVRRPLLWLDALQQYRGTLTAAPNFGQALVLARLERAARRDLSSVRVLVNGAEPIAAETMTAFLDALGPHGLRRDAMFPVYGLAEATLAVSFPEAGTEPVVEYVDRQHLHAGETVRVMSPGDPGAIAVVSEGRPVRGCEVRIAGGDEAALPEGVVGHVQVRGASVTRGYYGDAAATEDAFTADGWLRTGDLGFFREGRLHIAGREKDVLFVNGQNFYATDIEAVAGQAPGMERRRTAAVASRRPGDTADRLVLFVSGGNRPGDGEVFAAVRQRLQETLGLAPDAIVPIAGADFPRTTSGKLQRGRLRERFEAGEWTAYRAPSAARLAPRTPDERRVHAIWARELGLSPEDLGVDERFDEAGGTSLAAAAIAAALEDAYGGAIPPHVVANHSTVEGLSSLLAAGMAGLRLPGARKIVFRG